jgi:phage antirepressor YoqD-like protein
MKYNIDELKSKWNAGPSNGGVRTIMFDDVFGSHTHYNKRDLIKSFLIKHGVFNNLCSECDITDWNGKPITLQLDHIDGDRHNNQIDNLRLLCPNCHSQTETFSTRKKRTKVKVPSEYKTDESIIDAIETSENARQALMKLGLQAFGGNYQRIRKIKETKSIEFKKPRESKLPPMDELLEKLGKYSIKEIGEQYKVSDNAVRKWMKKYDIPITRNELKSFMMENGLVYDVKWRIKPIQLKGESKIQSKLTDDVVHEIHVLHQSGHTNLHIAKLFNVSKSTISNVLTGRTWKHVK